MAIWSQVSMPWSCRWSRGIPSSAATSGWWSSGTRRSSWMLLGGQSWRLTLVTRGEPGCGLRREWKVVVAKSVQHGVVDMSGYTYIYICIWVNLITTSLFSRTLRMMVSKGNHPQMAEPFRLVKYYNWPRYMYRTTSLRGLWYKHIEGPL